MSPDVFFSVFNFSRYIDRRRSTDEEKASEMHYWQIQQ